MLQGRPFCSFQLRPDRFGAFCCFYSWRFLALIGMTGVTRAKQLFIPNEAGNLFGYGLPRSVKIGYNNQLGFQARQSLRGRRVGGFALTPIPSPAARERGNPPRPHSTPLSHAVGEGLGVRANNSRRAPNGVFTPLETPIGKPLRLIVAFPHGFAPLLKVPPASRGEPKSSSVPPTP